MPQLDFRVTWWCGLNELFLVATPAGVGMAGFFKQWAKALPDNLLSAPTILTL
jgi:hypothetical protein